MPLDRRKSKNRRTTGAFVAVPFQVLNSDNYKKMSAKGVKLLWDVAAQLRFKGGGIANNGDLCITAKFMKDRGWNSRDSLYTARDELIHYGFITLTRQGYRNRCSLYAVTFLAIDECQGKLDVAATRVASNDWKESKKKWCRPPKNKQRKSQSKSDLLYRKPTIPVPIIGTTPQNQRCVYYEKLPTNPISDYF